MKDFDRELVDIFVWVVLSSLIVQRFLGLGIRNDLFMKEMFNLFVELLIIDVEGQVIELQIFDVKLYGLLF